MWEIHKSGSMRGNSGTGTCAIHCSLLYWSVGLQGRESVPRASGPRKGGRNPDASRSVKGECSKDSMLIG